MQIRNIRPSTPIRYRYSVFHALHLGHIYQKILAALKIFNLWYHQSVLYCLTHTLTCSLPAMHPCVCMYVHTHLRHQRFAQYSLVRRQAFQAAHQWELAAAWTPPNLRWDHRQSEGRWCWRFWSQVWRSVFGRPLQSHSHLRERITILKKMQV